MSSGYILLFAVLILGGVIATVGDRLGTRVGKARLSLFNLRPRRTATIITILTGTLISASTLGILLATNDQIWKAVFDLERIERRLKRTRVALEDVSKQKAQADQELQQANSDRTAARQQLAETQQQLTGAKQQLTETNQSLQTAIAQRSRAQAETVRTRTELSRTQTQLSSVSQQALKLRTEIKQLQTERDQVIAQREEEIKARDQVIAQREVRLRELEAQQDYLTREVQRLELEAQGLRQGNVAIQRGQILAAAVVRIVEPTAARPAVDQLLREANRKAIQLVRPGGTNEQIIQITKPEVEQLITRIDDGQDYVVRIFSAANYLVGERAIQVFPDVVRNQVVFLAGDVIAATTLDPSAFSDEQLQQRINLLIAAANFRARSLGILTDSVEIGKLQNLILFTEQLKQSKQPISLKAIASAVTYTAGPLKLELIAEQDGQILFRTQDAATTLDR